MSQSNNLILYHADCTDGFCAAWVARMLYGDSAEYIPVSYKGDIPEVKGRKVLILDFSYPRDILLRMKEEAESLTVLDHHKTAEEDLKGLDFCVFDMNRSGAGITYDYLVGGERPWVVNYVEDRDLWRWKLPNSRAINAAIRSYPMDFRVWSATMIGGHHVLEDMYQEGKAILRAQNQRIEDRCKQAELKAFENYIIPVINEVADTSDVLNELIEKYKAPFSLGWWRDLTRTFVYSLRSAGEVDVGQIARKYGGGGHKSSAGFKLNKLIV